MLYEVILQRRNNMINTSKIFKFKQRNKNNNPSSIRKKASVFAILTVLVMASFVSLVHAETYTFITSWGNSGDGDGQFSGPNGVAVDGAGNVFVSDNYNFRIQKFTGNGVFVTKWGSAGSGDGQFGTQNFYNGPNGIAVDGAGNVYVADTGNSRVQKFDGNGNFLAKWGSAGSGDGQFNIVYDVSVDVSGNIYVIDYGNNRIQKFSSSGVFLAKWGSAGSGDGQFNGPHGIAVDGAGNVYVADAFNNRIQKFSSSGVFLAKWGSAVSGDGQLELPMGVAVDGAGNVYVNERYHRVQKFDNDGSYITQWGSYGSDDGQFNILETGITIDSVGYVYVVDWGNNRVQKFASDLADLVPPTINLVSPIDYGLYPADSGATYEFSATDNIDLDVDLIATLIDIQGNSIKVQNGDSIPTESGVYDLTLTGTDDAGLSSSLETTFVVYDEDAGFVTGGGWLNSPEGAYTSDTSLTGKATFGFVSKYQKGANLPTGQTQFKFNVADLNFRSTSYDWLVVAGSKAQYKGTGTINGEGEYGFMLTATDGDIKGDGIDTFRIKIWDKTTDNLIYDNQIEAPDTADPTTAICGGSIVIHK